MAASHKHFTVLLVQISFTSFKPIRWNLDPFLTAPVVYSMNSDQKQEESVHSLAQHFLLAADLRGLPLICYNSLLQYRSQHIGPPNSEEGRARPLLKYQGHATNGRDS